MKVIQFALAGLFTASAIATTFAQTKTIDDFTSGPYQSPTYHSGTGHASTQTGTMLGGTRSPSIGICPIGLCATENPYNQGSSYGFFEKTATRIPAMVVTSGYDSGPRIDMGYGFGAHMDEDFTDYQNIRVVFRGLTQPLNFNIQLFTGTSWAQGGCNISPYNAEFTVELPLADFVKTTGFSLNHVNLMDFIFQNGSVIGGTSYEISLIELDSQPPASGVVIPCHY